MLTKTELRGHLLNIDDFGNLITNIGADLISRFAKLGEALRVKINGKELPTRFVKTFGDVRAEYLCYIGSGGLLELAKCMGNLAKEINVKRDSEIILYK